MTSPPEFRPFAAEFGIPPRVRLNLVRRVKVWWAEVMVMLKGILSFVVEHGEGGGECVAVRARLECDVEPGGVLADADFEALKAQLRTDYRNEHMCMSWWTEGGPDGVAVQHFAEDEVWIGHVGGVEMVRTAASDQYGFVVEESAEELFAELKALFEKGDWNFNRRGRVWWVEEEVYRVGNAD